MLVAVISFLCVFHVSLRSKWSPKYFTLDLVGMMELLIVNLRVVDLAGGESYLY
jgi:hypothetical protein